MSTSDLTTAIQARAETAGAVYLQRAPDDIRGTYAELHIDIYAGDGPQMQTVDVRCDVHSQVSAYAARELADAIEAVLHGWAPMAGGSSSGLYHESTQDIPSDQNDPGTTRLVMRFVGTWSSQARADALAGL